MYCSKNPNFIAVRHKQTSLTTAIDQQWLMHGMCQQLHHKLETGAILAYFDGDSPNDVC